MNEDKSTKLVQLYIKYGLDPIHYNNMTNDLFRLLSIVEQSEQLFCDNHRPDLEHFMKYSESICKNCKQKV